MEKEKIKMTFRPEIDERSKEDVQNELEAILSKKRITLRDIERGMRITGYGKDQEYWTLENGKSLAFYENFFFDRTMEIYGKKKEWQTLKKNVIESILSPFRELINFPYGTTKNTYSKQKGKLAEEFA